MSTQPPDPRQTSVEMHLGLYVMGAGLCGMFAAIAWGTLWTPLWLFLAVASVYHAVRQFRQIRRGRPLGHRSSARNHHE